MLRLDQLSFGYGEHLLFSEVTATADTGKLYLLRGHNGAGKSTLFGLISGRLRARAGKIFVEGREVTALSDVQRSPWMATLTQDPRASTIGSMTLVENLGLAGLKGQSTRLRVPLSSVSQDELEHLAHLMGKDPLPILHREVSSLSGGERQMLAFFMTTRQRPKVLLLDEPTAALDLRAAERLMGATRDYLDAHGACAVMITHDPQWSTLSDHHWHLRNGILEYN